VYAERGLDVPALERFMDAHGTVVGFGGGDALERKEELLLLDVVLLVPAAVEGVIHDGNADQVKARLVVEGANGPTTSGADTILHDKGVLVVPDILANAGGVVVSYFEWVQANQSYWWSVEEVERRLSERMRIAWERVTDHARKWQLSLRAAATSLAVETVAEAHKARGLYP
jgi:glutamate dehydrogenase (NAD(P)+)